MSCIGARDVVHLRGLEKSTSYKDLIEVLRIKGWLQKQAMGITKKQQIREKIAMKLLKTVPTRRIFDGSKVIGFTFLSMLVGTAGLSNVTYAKEASIETMKPIILTVTEQGPEKGIPGEAAKAFAEEVETKSKGKIKFDLYFSASLMPGKEVLKGLGSGLADIGKLQTAYFPKELPVATFLNDLGSMPSNSFPLGILQGGAAQFELFNSPELVNELAPYNVKVLATNYAYINYDLLCTKPVVTPEDAHGIRARVGGKVFSSEAKALGMTSVPLATGEMYDGLQKGVVDCVVLHPAGDIDYGLIEVAKDFTPIQMSGYLGALWAINLDVWNSLPSDAQRIMLEAGVTYWRVYTEGSIKKYAELAIDGVNNHGIKFHDPRQLDAVLEKFQKQYIKQEAESIKPQFANSTEFVAKFQSLLDKWAAILTTEYGYKEIPRDPKHIQQSWASFKDFNIGPYADRVKAENIK